MSKVLVVAVHPDDETLGCGGTLLKHKTSGDEIFWLIVTHMKEEDGFCKKIVLDRNKEIEIVKNKYGFSKLINLEISTTKVDKLPKHELVGKIGTVFQEVKAEIIYLPFMNDVHSDHRLIFESAYSCTKSFRYPFIKKVLMMETISETEAAPSIPVSAFAPNCFVDISNFLKMKIEIMGLFKGELGEHPFPRSIEGIQALATLRGAMAGVKYAEAFMTLKEIW